MSQTRHAGRHFLQIPGPTNVPDRVLRAIDNPTVDHRGPEFGRLGRELLMQTPEGLPAQIPAETDAAQAQARAAFEKDFSAFAAPRVAAKAT